MLGLFVFSKRLLFFQTEATGQSATMTETAAIVFVRNFQQPCSTYRCIWRCWPARITRQSDRQRALYIPRRSGEKICRPQSQYSKLTYRIAKMPTRFQSSPGCVKPMCVNLAKRLAKNRIPLFVSAQLAPSDSMLHTPENLAASQHHW